MSAWKNFAIPAICHTIIVIEGSARNMCKSLSIRLDVSKQIPKQISVVETK
jgi:hypothetical protein